MSYSVTQLTQMVAELTERLNQISNKAKTTEELPVLDPVDLDALIRVSSGGVSKSTKASNLQNNRRTEKYIFQSELNGIGSLRKQVVNVINSENQFFVEADELMMYILPVVTTPAEIVEVYIFWHKIGKGTWGAGSGNTMQESSITRGFRTRVRQDVVPLGDIGSTGISDYINGTGPYSEVAFTATINGEFKYYIYKGGADVIGDGNAQTVPSDFQDMTQEPTVDNGGNLINEDSLYDTYILQKANDIADFGTTVSLTEEFYFLVETALDKVWFASKQTNIEDFDGSRIYVAVTGEKHYLGFPDDSRDGYDFWDLGFDDNFPSSLTDGDTGAFQAWFNVDSKFDWGGIVDTLNGISANNIAVGFDSTTDHTPVANRSGICFSSYDGNVGIQFAIVNNTGIFSRKNIGLIDSGYDPWEELGADTLDLVLHRGNISDQDIILRSGGSKIIFEQTEGEPIVEIGQGGTMAGYVRITGRQSGSIQGQAEYHALKINVLDFGEFHFPDKAGSTTEVFAMLSDLVNLLTNTDEPNKVAMKDNSGKTLQVGKEFDATTTAYATTADLIATGYTSANGYLQGSELILWNTGDYTRYEKQSDDDNEWRVWKDSTDTWAPVPLV